MSRIGRSSSTLPLVVAGCAALLATVALLPAAHHQIGPSVAFMPALIAIVACFDLLSVYILVGDYRDRGDARLLLMAAPTRGR